MSTIYDRQVRRRKLNYYGNQFTGTFYNFITDFITDDCFFDVAKFKEKVLQIHEKTDLVSYIDEHYNKQTGKLIRSILAV